MMLSARRSVLLQSNLHFKAFVIPKSSTCRGHARCLSSLAVIEQRDGNIKNASLSAITAAQNLGGSVTALVAGGDVQSVAETVAKVKGVNKVIVINNTAYEKVHGARICGVQD